MQRTLHMLWHQGELNAPPWIQKNFQRVRELNPDYEVIIHDRQSVRKVLDGSRINFPSDIKIQNLSDIFRMTLLMEGGIWLDASAFLTKPLSQWVPQKLEESDFLAFSYNDNWRLPLSNWFLAAKADSLIMNRWFDAARSYWNSDFVAADEETNRRLLSGNPFEFMKLGGPSRNRVYPYFWSHFLFGHLIQSDKEFAEEWRLVSSPSSERAHLVQFELRKRSHSTKNKLKYRIAELLNRKNLRLKDKGLLMSSPIQKLDWRMDIDIDYWSSLAEVQSS
ncbi:capsular polysaccharide synthesis protein [Ruegeria arenilitoris]|uniref:capsular polysaccharide synthesis protein n=1 Tax=Ruegeria arenilitoris TaxID=1173585 RepID=UPI001C95B25D|nr:capsular polysaccharide synthesis protein [Ruegeria arenilitoris]MBY6081845.1 capsular polysaccharide synthesis protein [Ruegeria arenilitoris]